jgi:hypothetical protein
MPVSGPPCNRLMPVLSGSNHNPLDLIEPGDFYINGELDIVVKFAVDSLLEEGGFEPSVPLRVDTDAERSKPGLTDEDDMRVRPL